MTTRRVQLIDESRTVVATAQVADVGDLYEGTIVLRNAPAALRALFDEFEEIVNGQMFVFLDEIQGKIGAWPIKVVFEDGCEVHLKDLQVYPSIGGVSFRLVSEPSQAARLA